MRKSALLIVALVLAYFSPWLSSADDGAILFTWFNWLPTLAMLWLQPESAVGALALDVGVLTAQYLWLFSFIAHLRQLTTFVADFSHGPKHRSGLVR